MKEKMRFEEFTKAVVEGIKECLPERYENANISIQVVTKNNAKTLTGLTIQIESSNIAPMIYLEGFYKRYMDGAELDDVLKTIAEIRMESEMEDFELSQITDYDRCKDKIFPRLIGASWNKELLERHPHVRIADLAVTFHINLGAHNEGNMSVPVQDQLMMSWGLTAEELFEQALNNLQCAKNATFMSMSETIKEMMLPDMITTYDGDEEQARQELDKLVPMDDQMFVLTNEEKVYGACVILDKQLMKRVMDRIGKEFYILPSSVHECLVVPAQVGMEVEDLEAMVREVNANEVAVDERLSDHVYKYSEEKGIEIA